ncbi:MAG: inorganic pyrophosphatase [Bacteroidales bacterium]|nr:inorganic pyrophosphatase [Bacteroidales bacterium]
MFPSVIYPVDYGYITNTKSMDGSCIDVFLGNKTDMQVTGIMCTIDMIKNDSEIKVMVGCSSQEINTVLAFLNNSAFMKAIFIDRFNS